MSTAWLFAQRCAIVLVLLVGARVARPVLVPVLLAAVFCVLMGDLAARSAPRRSGSLVARAAAVAMLPLALALAALLLGGFMPRGSREFDAARAVLVAMLARIDPRIDLGWMVSWLQSVDDASLRSLLQQQLTDAALVLAEAGVLSFFALLSVRSVSTRLGQVLALRRCARLRWFVEDLRRGLVACLTIMLAMNAGLALALAVSLGALGVPHAPGWAGIVFVLLFVPYLGPLGAIGLLLLAGAAHFGATPAMLTPALAFACLHGIEANLISPWLTARRLQTNRLAVLIAVLAGTWAWGVIGGLLALPLLLALRLALAHEKKWPVLRELLAAEAAVGWPAPPSR